ncbi:CBS domain-containing protein [Streptomyces sp. ODS28]|uniref:CBS domain-containing protein n=1 Tax=Streptomyces sp. ODS28 TaxID=3136688 RepID=UPI0031EA9DA5
MAPAVREHSGPTPTPTPTPTPADRTHRDRAEHGPYLVEDVMTRAVVAVGRHAPFKEIARTLEQWKVSAVPVLEGDGRVVGVVSEADLLRTEEERDGDPRPGRGLPGAGLPRAGLPRAGLTAGDLMSAPAVTVRAEAPLPEAARIMARARLKRLPVVGRDGFLLGVVSRGDLLTVFLRDDAEIAREVHEQLRRLFPAPLDPLGVRVEDGVVTVTGVVQDAFYIPLAVRMVRGVEGVVGVDCRLADAAESAAGAARRRRGAQLDPGWAAPPEGPAREGRSPAEERREGTSS